MIEKHYEWSSYCYVYNNPTKYFDPFGLDSAQRAQAVNLAEQYVNKNPGDSYELGARGKPGENTDCAGVADNCEQAGGENSPIDNPQNVIDAQKTYNDNRWVARIAVSSDKVKDKNKLQNGNFVVIDNPGDKTSLDHIGVITEVYKNKDGTVRGFQFNHSHGTTGSGTSGPGHSYVYFDGTYSYYNTMVQGYLKWDKKPDVVSTTNQPKDIH